MNSTLLTILAILFMATPIFSQSLLVQGTVTNLAGDPLPGATVVLKGTTTGTATLADGTYSLEVPDGQAVLIVSFLGYESQEVNVNGRSNVNVQFRESVSQLNQVIVTAFGTQSRNRLTSTISSAGEEVFQDVSVPVFQRALQGRLPGVVMTNASGGLDAETVIRIRGTGSISASNQPLIVVDGLILSSRPGPESMGYGLNPFMALNPNDIASVEVLKDAAATVLYGARGSNGVILITTKKGNFNQKPKVQLGYYAGFSEMSKRYGLLDGKEYATLYNQAALATDPNATNLYDVASQPSTDWQDLITRKGFVQETSASLTGGTPASAYYFGGSYRDEDSYMKTVGLKRYSLRAGIDQKIGEHFTAGLTVAPSKVVNNRTGNQYAGSPLGTATWFAPNVEAFDETGRCRRDQIFTSNGDEWGTSNPCVTIEDQWIETNTLQKLANGYLGWSPLSGLFFKTELGVEASQIREFGRHGAAHRFGAGGAGTGWEQNQQVFNYNWTTLGTWRNTWANRHDLDATVGVQLTKEAFDYSYVAYSGFTNDRVRYINSAAQIDYSEGVKTSAAFLGYFSRLNYAFQQKYLLTLSARYDGSSRFSPDRRYGFFPAVSAGWIISAEDFFKTSNIDFLKLRSSLGLTGNAEIGDFAYPGLASVFASYGDEPGSIITSIDNFDLGWEKNRQLDVGLDFVFFKNRLRGSVDYYVRDTRDLLLDAPVPATNGVTTITQNVGEVRNQGFEFDLGFDVLQGDFSWTVQANGATLKNEVRRLADNDGDGVQDDIVFLGRMLFRPGESIGTFYLVKYAGVNPANGDALFFDLEGNKLSNQAPASNRQIVGQSLPKFTGGFTNVFRFKNWDLSAFFHFKKGHKIYLEDRQFYLENNMATRYNQVKSQLDAWTLQNTDTNVPEARLYEGNGNQASTRYLHKADYLRLQNLMLGYRFKSIGRAGARLRLFAAAQNLLTFTKFPGTDPDSEFYTATAATVGTVRQNLPASRTITFGLNLEY